MKIYVASSWRNKHQPIIVNLLKRMNNEVYDFRNPNDKTGFGWSQIETYYRDWEMPDYIEALKNPVAQAGFDEDFNAMKWADCCLLVLPSGRSSNLEAGWFVGSGKPVWVYQEKLDEPELMYKMTEGFITDMNDLHKVFNTKR